MYKAFGIVNSSSRNIRVEGLEDYRPIGAFSFLGRYRMVDFPISNLSNSGIDRIQVYVKEKPRTLVPISAPDVIITLTQRADGCRFFSLTATRETISITPILLPITKIWNASKKCIIHM